MSTILTYCAAETSLDAIPSETILLEEGKTSGRLVVLAEGAIEVVRGDTTVAILGEPGSIFGEMSVLLGVPHTATVRAMTDIKVYVIDDAAAFLRAHPDIAFMLAKLLAQRLNAATTYLVDLRRQFEGHGNHLGMVGDVLESLVHQQEDDVSPGSDRQPDPRM